MKIEVKITDEAGNVQQYVVSGSLPLPTDDEIKNAAPCCPEADRMDIQAHNWFIAGAKWCRMVMSIPVGNDR